MPRAAEVFAKLALLAKFIAADDRAFACATS